MTEAVSAEAGNAGGAAALLDTPAAATTTEAAATTTQATTQAATDKPWFDGIDDPELKSWATNKNFPDIKTALDSYRNVEKLLGGDKVPVPKDENDKEGWDRFYKAAGRPDEPTGYKLPVNEGIDPAFATEASKWFHESGLSAKQGEALAKNWNAYAEKMIGEQQKAFQVQSAQDMDALRQEWGAQNDANIELYRRTARQFGIDQTTAAKMEQAVGTKAFMGLMVKIGQGLGEHAFETGDVTGAGFTGGQTAALARIDALKGDTEWMKSYLGGDKAKLAQMEQLQRAAYPGEQS